MTRRTRAVTPRAWAAIILVTALILSGLLLARPGGTPVMTPAGPQPAAGHTLVSQAAELTEAYQRMLSLGWPHAEITYNDQGPGDLLHTHRLTRIAPGPAEGGAFADSVWRLGGGEVVGRYSQGQRDVVFFIPGLKQEVCRALNAQLWQDPEPQSPLESSTTVEDWQTRAAEMVEAFGGRSRAEACIRTKEGLYLYYKVAYSPKKALRPQGSSGASSPPPPTIPPPSPLPPGADPELKIPPG
jgi:hypothetical protein